MARYRLSKAKKQEQRQNDRRLIECEALALAAFPHIHREYLQRHRVEGLTEEEARTFVHKVHYGNIS